MVTLKDHISSYGALSTVFCLSFLTFVSSFLAGILPLSVTLSARRLRILSSVGAGLLIGTALVVIIPEGVNALYAWERDYVAGQQKTKSKNGKDTEEYESDLSTTIGMALVLGFMGMYLVDVWPTIASSRSHQGGASTGNSGHELDALPLHESSGQDATNNGQEPKYSKSTSQMFGVGSKASVLTTGLLIHSLLDGVALGTSASLPSASLIVFFAILVHKAPAAFGLTSSLLKQGLHKRAIRTHLFLFSAAAPLGAILSWAIIHLMGSSTSSGKTESAGKEEWWAGMGMVLSGGTFLYVAVHSMLESMPHNGHGHGHDVVDRSESQGGQSEQRKLAKLDMLCTVIGMMLPLLMRLGAHGHAH